jgi:regulator of sigma D
MFCCIASATENRVLIFFCQLAFDYISDGVWEIGGRLTDFAVLGWSFAKAFLRFPFYVSYY